MRVMNLTKFNTVEGTLEVDSYLYALWQDPYMIGMGEDRVFNREPEHYEQLWNPRLEVNHSQAMAMCLSANAAWNFKSSTIGALKYTQR